MIHVKNTDEKQIFDEIVQNNFKPTNNKSISRIAAEVFIQLAAVWAIINLGIYVWRVCTGC
jgi:hypothetical protein